MNFKKSLENYSLKDMKRGALLGLYGICALWTLGKLRNYYRHKKMEKLCKLKRE